MRAIDGDRLLRELTALSHGQVWPGWTYEGIRLLIERQPTLTPPNEQLMPDELKEMGGKPVWTVGVSYTDDGKWAMWDIVEKADDEGVDFGYSTEGREWWNYNLRDKAGELLGCAWACYRRPPEGEEDAL